MNKQARTTVETYIRINNGVKTRQQMSDDLGLSYTKLSTIVARMRRNGQIKQLFWSGLLAFLQSPLRLSYLTDQRPLRQC
jgi:hypothetical protein